MAQEQMRIVPEFYMANMKDEKASAEAGRPIHKEVEMCRIKFIGDNKKVIDEPADLRTTRDRATNQWISYKEKFPEHYAAFKRNQQYFGPGTPIDEAPFLSVAEKADMKAIQIYTIEALANLDMAGQRKFGMGAAAYVAKAKAYIDNASGSANVLKLASENAQMKEQLEHMQRQMAELLSRPAPQPAVPVSQPIAPLADEDDGSDVSGSPFMSWDDASLKAWIKEKSGSAPRGQPSHETLVRMAEQANARTAEAA
jgi:hypothetical protein